MYTLLYLSVTYFWLHQAFVAACGLSLAVASRLLTAVASLAVEHRLWAPGLQSLQHTGSGVVICWCQGVRASVVVAQGLTDCGSRALECAGSVVAACEIESAS